MKIKHCILDINDILNNYKDILDNNILKTLPLSIEQVKDLILLFDENNEYGDDRESFNDLCLQNYLTDNNIIYSREQLEDFICSSVTPGTRYIDTANENLVMDILIFMARVLEDVYLKTRLTIEKVHRQYETFNLIKWADSNSLLIEILVN